MVLTTPFAVFILRGVIAHSKRLLGYTLTLTSHLNYTNGIEVNADSLTDNYLVRQIEALANNL
jgi:hypothetical protein